jgi:hypothetical protein
LVSGEAESTTTRAGLGEPFALSIVVTRFTDAVAEGTSGHACAVRFDLTFAVLLTVGSGEDFAGATASLELTDPLAIRVGGTGTRVGDGRAGADTFRALVVPEAIRVGFTLSGAGVGNRTSGLAGFVDLHTLTRLTAAGGVTRELVTSSGAGSSGGVPLAAGVGLAFGGAVLVGFRADGRASGGGRVPRASTEVVTARFRLSRAITNAVTEVVGDAVGGSSTISSRRAGVSASVGRGVELTIGVASA